MKGLYMKNGVCRIPQRLTSPLVGEVDALFAAGEAGEVDVRSMAVEVACPRAAFF
jgi:hypothetical protein